MMWTPIPLSLALLVMGGSQLVQATLDPRVGRMANGGRSDTGTDGHQQDPMMIRQVYQQARPNLHAMYAQQNGHAPMSMPDNRALASMQQHLARGEPPAMATQDWALQHTQSAPHLNAARQIGLPHAASPQELPILQSGVREYLAPGAEPTRIELASEVELLHSSTVRPLQRPFHVWQKDEILDHALLKQLETVLEQALSRGFQPSEQTMAAGARLPVLLAHLAHRRNEITRLWSTSGPEHAHISAEENRIVDRRNENLLDLIMLTVEVRNLYDQVLHRRARTRPMIMTFAPSHVLHRAALMRTQQNDQHLSGGRYAGNPP